MKSNSESFRPRGCGWKARAAVPASLLAILTAGLVAGAGLLEQIAAQVPTAACGVAVVDGSNAEWSSDDFFANMYRAGNPSRPIESTASLRYDATTGTLYVLVMQANGSIPVLVQSDAAFVKIPAPNGTVMVSGGSGNNGVPPDFAWVGRGYDGNNDHARGWEGSFRIDPGTYTINIHVNVFNQEEQTSAVSNRNVPLTINCPALAKLGDYVWVDLNGNGLQDETNTGQDDVTVNLYKGDGTFVSSETTANGGYYRFDGLMPGDYYVVVEPPAGYVFSPKDQGGDDALDSDANANGRMATTTLVSGEHDLTWDAGLVLRTDVASITGSVYDDLTAIPDQNKNVPLPNVSIRLYLDADADGFPEDYQTPYRTTTTDNQGYYEFLNVPIGPSYVIIEEDPPGYLSTYDVFTTWADNRIALEVPDPGVYPLNDFWDYIPGDSGDSATELGSLVWLDTNNDGRYDAGTENGIDGVDLLLWQVVNGVRQDADADDTNGDTPFRATTTAAGGLYRFSNLPPGGYQVEIPADNFTSGGALSGATLTSGTPAAADNQQDNDNNGVQVGGPGTVIYSPVITLAADLEPVDGLPPGPNTEFGPGALQDNADDNNGDMTVDFGLRPNPPTAARLAYFRALRTEGGAVRVSWGTLVEVDLLGFRVERMGPDGQWTPLGAGVIPAQGAVSQPQAYGMEDNGSTDTNQYRLTAIDLRGRAKVLAETAVRFGTALRALVSGGSLRIEVRGEPESLVMLESAVDAAGGLWETVESVGLDSAGHGTVSRPLDGTAPIRFYRVRE